MESITLMFFIRNTHESTDKSLRAYEKSTGRTLPERKHKAVPRDGEIIIEVNVRGRPKQISVHPRFLTPLKPVVGGGVVVVRGDWLGTLGVAKEKGVVDKWLVAFTVDGISWDIELIEKDITATEPFST